MDISVIVPCHNLEDYIERCLESIIAQIYGRKNFEIIVVLDSCTDGTKRITKRILNRKGLNSIIIATDVKSAGLTRNIGLELAAGRFISFIDGDDYLVDTAAFKKLSDNLKDNRSNAVYMNNFEGGEEGNLNRREADAVWRYFYDRSVIADTRFTNLPFDEDIQFVRKIKGKSIYKQSYIDDVIYHYTHPRKGSITTKYSISQKTN